MTTPHRPTAVLVVGLLLTAGCYSDGLTRQQRFELRQQQSRQNHEWLMAVQQNRTQLRQRTVFPTTAPAGPYSLRMDAAGRPVLIVNGFVPEEYTIDLQTRTLSPATRPAP